jgi:energy-coupling factor transporter ATP-binding protein EcfA2
VEESGQPYPGAEGKVAELIDKIKLQQEIEASADRHKRDILARRRAQDLAEAEGDGLREITAIRASDIVPKRVRWLWAPGDEGKGRIPLGELTLIVGRGGIGKSTLLAEFAAWITRGEMRGEYYGTPKDVLYVANEDSLEYTVAPRLLAAGADMSRVHFIGVSMIGRPAKVLLPSDCAGLAQYAKENNAAAIMLDPLSSNLKLKQGTGNEIRPIVEAVRSMAESAGVACVGLAHTRKAASSNLLDALLGSVELGNVCRSAMGVMRDDEADDGSVVLSQEKNNLGDVNVDSYKYKIANATMWQGEEVLSTGRIEWLGRTPVKVSDMMHESATAGITSRSAVADAADFLRDYLTTKGGQDFRSDVMKMARGEGFNDKAVERAAKRLGIESRPSGQGAKRLWVMPPGAGSRQP